VTELQGGPVAEGLLLRRTPEPADIRRWVFACLAAGARGLCFSSHRAEMVWSRGYGFGLLDSAGEKTARAEEASRLARALQQHAALFAQGWTPEPEVAVVVSDDLRHFAEAAGNHADEHLRNSVAGLYKALWDEAIPVAFLSAEALADSVGRYRALILPFPLALGATVIDTLRRFVTTGGTLVSEACPGRFDPYGFGTDGEMPAALVDLFGARHAGLAMLRARGEGHPTDAEDPLARDGIEQRELTGSGAFTAHAVSPSYYLQTLAVTQAVPILKDGESVTGSAVTFGKGRAYLIGTLLGEGALLHRDARNGRFLAALLATAGVAPDRVGRLVRRRRILGRQTAWFLFNNSDLAVEERVPTEGREARDLYGESLIVEEGQVRLRLGPRDVRCLILA
jgi:beta-galactosidase